MLNSRRTSDTSVVRNTAPLCSAEPGNSCHKKKGVVVIVIYRDMYVKNARKECL